MVIEVVQKVLGTQGLRLLAKVVLIVAGFSLFTKKPDILTGILGNSYGLDFLTGANILGVLVLFTVIMMHKNYI